MQRTITATPTYGLAFQTVLTGAAVTPVVTVRATNATMVDEPKLAHIPGSGGNWAATWLSGAGFARSLLGQVVSPPAELGTLQTLGNATYRDRSALAASSSKVLAVSSVTPGISSTTEYSFRTPELASAGGASLADEQLLVAGSDAGLGMLSVQLNDSSFRRFDAAGTLTCGPVAIPGVRASEMIATPRGYLIYGVGQVLIQVGNDCTVRPAIPIPVGTVDARLAASASGGYMVIWRPSDELHLLHYRMLGPNFCD